MSSRLTGKCAIALALASSFAHASRIKRSAAQLSADNSVSGATCPQTTSTFIKVGDGSTGACGEPLQGRLTFGMISGKGFKSGDSWSKNDPYVQFKITDRQSGTTLADPQSTKTLNNNDAPEWKQYWVFDFLCPQTPSSQSSYTLEATVWDSDTTFDDNLGSFEIALDDVISGAKKGASTLSLEGGDDVTGSVRFVVTYCDWRDTSCASEVQTEKTENGLSGAAVAVSQLDCDMSCESLFDPYHGDIGKAVAAVKQHFSSALYNHQQGLSACDRADKSFDQIANLQDSFMNTENGRVQRQQLLQMQSSEKASMLVQRLRCSNLKNESLDSWGEGLEALSLLNVPSLGTQFCGHAPVLDELLSSASDGLTAKMPSSTCFCPVAAEEIVERLSSLEDQLKQVRECLSQNWWKGELVVRSSQVSSQCSSYFDSD